MILAVQGHLLAQDSTKTELYLGHFLEDSSTIVYPLKSGPIKVAPIQESKHKVEIRLFTYRSFHKYDMIILTFDTYWSMHFCAPKKFIDSTVFTEVERTDLDSVFAVLVTNKVFSLPDDDSIMQEKSVLIFEPEANDEAFYGMASDMVIDGNHYWLEYKVGPYFRRYHYGNPELMNDFGPFVEEYQLFTNILTLLHSLIPDGK
ncbi:MAG: hypothetical protein QE487_12150 [Fluviicola sp.]|nr:hypothetical protein [Fluviicola sp.]